MGIQVMNQQFLNSKIITSIVYINVTLFNEIVNYWNCFTFGLTITQAFKISYVFFAIQNAILTYENNIANLANAYVESSSDYMILGESTYIPHANMRTFMFFTSAAPLIDSKFSCKLYHKYSRY